MIEEDDDYTVDELLAMDDEDFADAVTEDLVYAGRHSSPFQAPELARRTLTVLVERVWFIDAVLQRNADNAEYSAERWEKSLAFRRHLLSVIDVTERRIRWMEGGGVRETRKWKALLNELCDEIEGSSLDWLLDEFTIPFREWRSGGEVPDGPKMSLRMWLEVRRVKDPSRIPERAVAA